MIINLSIGYTKKINKNENLIIFSKKFSLLKNKTLRLTSKELLYHFSFYPGN